VHTPASILNNQFGNDWDSYTRELFRRALEDKIAVIGITDYFCCDGYRKIRAEYLEDPERLKTVFAEDQERAPHFLKNLANILVLANVELRLDKFLVTRPEKTSKKPNLHVLFSDEVSPDDIDELFLSRVEFDYDGDVNIGFDRRTLTKSNLERLGELLKKDEPSYRGKGAYRVGCENAAVSHKQVLQVLGTTREFRGKYVVALADEGLSRINWGGGDHNARRLLSKGCDIFFTSNKRTIEWLLSDEFFEKFDCNKAAIWGSDAHRFEDLFEPAGGRYCWIKADPTFSGLKQVMCEPGERVYIGELPEQLESWEDNSPHLVDSITLRKKDESLDEKWFEGVHLDFNAGLVAVIGNKGSGKSALADIVALLADSSVDEENFAFLNSQRFREPNPNRSEFFEGLLTWANGDSNDQPRPLSEDVPAREERAKYLPQNFLERVCNTYTEGETSLFDRELKQVIFSHVGAAEREDAEGLDSLIEARRADLFAMRQDKQQEIRRLNQLITDKEDAISKASLGKAKQKLERLEEEHKRHVAGKPKEVKKPREDDPKKREILQKIAQAEMQIAVLEESISILKSWLLELTRLDDIAESVKNKLRRFYKSYQDLEKEIANDLNLLGFKMPDLITLEIRGDKFKEIRKDLRRCRNNIEQALDASGGMRALQQKSRDEIKTSRTLLKKPDREYQSYLQQLKKWNARSQLLVGAKDKPNTVNGQKELLRRLREDAPRELAGLREERETATREVFELLQEELGVMKRYYSPVQKAILENAVTKDQVDLRIDACIRESGFLESFFKLVSHQPSGTFRLIEQGRKRLQEMLATTDYEHCDGVIKLVNRLLSGLAGSSDDSKDLASTIDTKLKERGTRKLLYDLLFSLDYLEPKFELRLDGKKLNKLSPGERGLLLLLFYLLVDNNQVPLIVDQPEENIDNQSVYRYLVPAIKFARQRRQVIIVTHNPNLAVVCDAEQVIFADIDKADGNRVSYVSGSIENPNINKRLVDILEGTKPAFRNRGSKYRVTDSI